MSLKTVVIDLDGTLANVNHRVHYLRCDKPDWDAFYTASDKDTPNEWCVRLIRAFLNLGIPVRIVTARRDSERAKTEEWVLKNLGRLVPMNWVRVGTDTSKDADLKRDWLISFGKEKILFVVDDRQRVVDMWRKEGVVCLQCAQWEEYRG